MGLRECLPLLRYWNLLAGTYLRPEAAHTACIACLHIPFRDRVNTHLAAVAGEIHSCKGNTAAAALAALGMLELPVEGEVLEHKDQMHNRWVFQAPLLLVLYES